MRPVDNAAPGGGRIRRPCAPAMSCGAVLSLRASLAVATHLVDQAAKIARIAAAGARAADLGRAVPRYRSPWPCRFYCAAVCSRPPRRPAGVGRRPGLSEGLALAVGQNGRLAVPAKLHHGNSTCWVKFAGIRGCETMSRGVATGARQRVLKGAKECKRVRGGCEQVQKSCKLRRTGVRAGAESAHQCTCHEGAASSAGGYAHGMRLPRDTCTMQVS